MSNSAKETSDSLCHRLAKSGYLLYSGDDLPPVEHLPLNNAALDFVLGGGFPLGRCVQLHGPTNSGKSTTAVMIAIEFFKAGYPVAYIDAEHALSQQDLRRLGVPNSPEFMVLKPSCAEDAVRFIQEAAPQGIKLFVIDSIATLEPKAKLEKLEADPGSVDMALKARFWANNQGLLLSQCSIHGASILFLNQVRENIKPYAAPASTPGGSAIRFMSSVILEFNGTSKLADEVKNIPNLAISTRSTMTVRKSRFGPKGTAVTLDISNQGIDPYTALINVAKAEGLITKGANPKLSEELGSLSLGRGFESAYHLLSSPEGAKTYNLLYDKLRELAQNNRRTLSEQTEDDDDGSS